MEVDEFLIEHDANFDTRAKNEALRVAVRSGHLEVAKLLVENGASVNAKTNLKSEILLMNSAWKGQLEIVKFLIENDANINAQGTWGGTALMSAARSGHLEVVVFLLENGASVGVRNEDGWTELMYAASNGHFKVVELLIEKKADVDVQDERGWTALMYAADNGKNSRDPKFQQEFRKIMDLLLAAKANPLLKAKDGTTVLEQGDSETVEKCMRKIIPRILVEEVAPELSLVLPKDLADLIAKLTYGCELAQ